MIGLRIGRRREETGGDGGRGRTAEKDVPKNLEASGSPRTGTNSCDIHYHLNRRFAGSDDGRHAWD